MPAIYHEGSWLGNATDPEVLVKDTVGWTGKNLLKNTATSQTVRGVTFTVNSDGSVTANGTATGGNASLSNWSITLTLPAGKYILSGCPSGGRGTYALLMQDEPYTESIFDYGDGAVIDISETKTFHPYFGYVREGVTVSNLTFRPMIRKADITDPTYEPYHESVEEEIEQVYADNGVLGAKNLLPNNAKSQTVNGVTFTVNADGSVAVNGTATANTFFTYADEIFPDSPYILSGCPSGGDMESYCADFRKRSDGNTVGFRDYGEEVQITLPTTELVHYTIRIASGYTANNLTFHPMLRLASDPDDTYQPYAMTNRELTEKVFEKRTITSNDDLNDITETGIYHITTSPANAPDSMSYCTLLVSKRDNTDIQQVIYRAADNVGLIYIRAKGGNPSTWKSWFKFTGTVVS